MPTIFYSLAILACPLGMGLMMWFMMRGNKEPTSTGSSVPDAGAELARLRAEIDQLQAAQRETSTTPQDTRPAR
jgi:hypothetical protein